MSLGQWAAPGSPRDPPEILDRARELLGFLRTGLAVPDRVTKVAWESGVGFCLDEGPDLPLGAADVLLTPPECLDGAPLTERGWIYVTGACMYQLLTGNALFPSKDMESLQHRIRWVEPTTPSFLISAVPDNLEALLFNCLEKVPEDRYGTLADLLDSLDRVTRGDRVGRLRESGFSPTEEVLVLDQETLAQLPEPPARPPPLAAPRPMVCAPRVDRPREPIPPGTRRLSWALSTLVPVIVLFMVVATVVSFLAW